MLVSLLARYEAQLWLILLSVAYQDQGVQHKPVQGHALIETSSYQLRPVATPPPGYNLRVVHVVIHVGGGYCVQGNPDIEDVCGQAPHDLHYRHQPREDDDQGPHV